MKACKGSIAMLLAVILLALAGCTSNESGNTPQPASSPGTQSSTPSQPAGSQPDAAKEYNYTAWIVPDRGPFLELAYEFYTKDHPNFHIEWVFIDWRTLKENSMVAAASGSLPEIYYNWTGQTGDYYWKNGLAYDLTEIAKERDWENKYCATSMQLVTGSDGRVWAHPFNYQAIEMIYRKDIFDASGVTSAPTTFEEMENAFEAIKNAGYIPFALGGGDNGDFTLRLIDMLFARYLGQEEHHKLFELYEGSFAGNQGVIDALNKLKEWYDKGYFVEGFLTTSQDDARKLMTEGKAAINTDCNWIIPIINSDADMSVYDVFHMPPVTPGGFCPAPAYSTEIMFNPSLEYDEVIAALEYFEFAFDDNNKDVKHLVPQLMPSKTNTLPDKPGFEIVENILAFSNQHGIVPMSDSALPPVVRDKEAMAIDMVLAGTATAEEACEMIQAELEAYLALNG